ncbi:MAG: PaaI family thioesterase [Alphaproteobacteria bacterium]|nr:PaaI family thioesterase [Alphaproteobacteria bacterium]
MTAKKAPNPDFARRVRESFARQGFMIHIGAEISHLAPGECDIRLPYRKDLTQQHGFVHGGVVGTIADNAGGYAAFTLAPASASVLTVEFKVNLLAPAEGEVFISRGRVVRAGRNLATSRTDVFAVKDGKEKQIATALVTLMYLEGRSDEPDVSG